MEDFDVNVTVILNCRFSGRLSWVCLQFFLLRSPVVQIRISSPPGRSVFSKLVSICEHLLPELESRGQWIMLLSFSWRNVTASSQKDPLYEHVKVSGSDVPSLY